MEKIMSLTLKEIEEKYAKTTYPNPENQISLDREDLPKDMRKYNDYKIEVPWDVRSKYCSKYTTYKLNLKEYRFMKYVSFEIVEDNLQGNAKDKDAARNMEILYNEKLFDKLIIDLIEADKLVEAYLKKINERYVEDILKNPYKKKNILLGGYTPVKYWDVDWAWGIDYTDEELRMDYIRSKEYYRKTIFGKEYIEESLKSEGIATLARKDVYGPPYYMAKWYSTIVYPHIDIAHVYRYPYNQRFVLDKAQKAALQGIKSIVENQIITREVYREIERRGGKNYDLDRLIRAAEIKANLIKREKAKIRMVYIKRTE